MTQIPTKRRRGRPPAGRSEQQQDTRSAIIRAGLAMLTEKGISASGIDGILRQAGVPKGSFYHYFSSKNAFVDVLLEEYNRYFLSLLARSLSREELSPLARLEAFAGTAAEGMARHGFRRGCLIGNIGHELSNLPESFISRVQDIFRQWQDAVAACIEAAIRAGDLPPETDPQQAAALFWTGWEGAVLQARIRRSAGPLYAYMQFFIAGLRAGA